MRNHTTSPQTMSRHMILGQLYTNDIHDPQILQAMAEVPRESFVPEGLRGAAYVDEDLEIAPGRYLMEPLTFAMLLDLAKITPSCRVLDIGCLTGYSAAVIAKLSRHVVATESDETSLQQARAHMKRLGLSHVRLEKVGGLAEGCAPDAPYNVIIINGAIEVIPEQLGVQLAEGGRLVAVRNVARRPDLQGGLGKGLLVEKIDGQLQYRDHFDAGAAMLPGFERKAGFVF